MKQEEKDVQKIIKAFQGCLGPFLIDDKDNLYCVSSGSAAPQDIAEDFLSAQSNGKGDFDKFVEDRFKTKTFFYDPIKRKNQIL